MSVTDGDVTFHCSPLRYRELMKADEDNAKLRAALRACQEERAAFRDEANALRRNYLNETKDLSQRADAAERALSDTVQALQHWEVESDTLRATLAARDAALQACQVEQEALIVQGHEALSAHADKAAADLRACQEERDRVRAAGVLFETRSREHLEASHREATKRAAAERALSDTVQALQDLIDAWTHRAFGSRDEARRAAFQRCAADLSAARLRATLAPQAKEPSA